MKLLKWQTKKLVILKEENNMRFLENVRAEFMVQDVSVEGGEDRHFVIDLRAMIGDRIVGNAVLDIPTRYPYSLSIEERMKSTSLIDKRFDIEYTYIPVVSGIAYISLDEIAELKKDPYKFCIENGIIEGNKETKSDNDETSTDQEG